MSLDAEPQCGRLTRAVGDDTAVETSILSLGSGENREVRVCTGLRGGE